MLLRTGERSVPLLLGLAPYCTSFGGLKGRGRFREVRHGKRATDEDVVDDKRTLAGTGQSGAYCPVEVRWSQSR
jgi:hypothetical protein